MPKGSGRKLPDSWGLVSLADIRLDTSHSIDPQQFPDDRFELYSVTQYEHNEPELASGSDIRSSKRVVKLNSVLLCKINPRINRVWIVGNYSTFEKIASTEWIIFEPLPGLNPKYLRYFMMQNAFRDLLAANVSGIGGSLMRINLSVLEKALLPLPPLPEQELIVAQIEKQFARIEEAIANLQTADENLRHLRSSTLAAACEGQLVPTEANIAKVENRGYETASMLVDRLVAERQKKWEEAFLANSAAHNKMPNTDSWKRKYTPPVPPDSSKHILPEGWTWASLDQLSWHSSYGTSEKTSYEWTGTPVLRIPNIVNSTVDVTDLKRAKGELTINDQTKLLPGDFLVVRTNGSKDLLGRAGLVRLPFPEAISFASYLIRFRLADDVTVQEWISIVWNSEEVRKTIESMAATTAGQYNVRLSNLKGISFPLPPLAEQRRIVDEFQRRIAEIQASELTVSDSVAMTNDLRSKILESAFEGKLLTYEGSAELPAIRIRQLINEKSILERRPRSVIQKEKKRASKPVKTTKPTLPFQKLQNMANLDQPQPNVKHMKLISLRLDGQYKSLRDFDEVFRRGKVAAQEMSPICLVGLNGSGKSNLIELCAEIFCYLEIINLPYKKLPRKDKQSALRFQIEYDIPSKRSRLPRRIRISKVDDTAPTFVEIINDKERVIEDPETQLEVLPTRIIGYSSGLNETISIPFLRTKSFYSMQVAKRAFDEQKGKVALPPIASTRTLFMDYDSNAAILLSNYLFSSKRSTDVFRRYVRIDDVASFKITIQLVYGNKRPVRLTAELKDTIARLQLCANDIIKMPDKNGFTLTYEVSPERRRLFREQFGSGKSFFTAIYKLSLLNVLALTGSERRFYRRDDIKEGMIERPPTIPKEEKIFNIEELRLKLTEPATEIDYAGISDGEHQLIHLFGTVKLFDEPGCLFLLDEPETHFNPLWRKEFVQILQALSSPKRQEFMISTHSPFIVSGCRRENVFKFQREKDDIQVARVNFETYGSSFDYLLLNLFDLDSLISEQAFDDLKDYVQSESLKKLESAVPLFGESFEKRFLFEKIEKVRSKNK